MRKAVGILVALTAILLISLLLWFQWSIRRRWALLHEQAEALLIEEAARDSRRTVLRGKMLDGNAWDYYLPALRDVSTIPDGDQKLLEAFLAGSTSVDRARVEAIVSVSQAAIDALRAGSQRTTNPDVKARTRAAAWENNARQLGVLAACRARLLAEVDRVTEAAELLLDACQFGCDIGRSYVPAAPLEEIHRLILGGKRTRENLQQIAAELEILDKTFAISARRRCRNLSQFSSSCTASEEELEKIVAPPFRPSWRFGFSKRLAAADAFETLSRTRLRLDETDEKPWIEAEPARSLAMQECQTSRNPILANHSGEFLPTALDQYDRATRAQIRLLRIAAHYCAVGEVLDLEDPCGSRLKVERKASSIKAWSVGPDGGDRGGQGRFAVVWLGDKNHDIVVEVSR